MAVTRKNDIVQAAQCRDRVRFQRDVDRDTSMLSCAASGVTVDVAFDYKRYNCIPETAGKTAGGFRIFLEIRLLTSGCRNI